MIPLSFQLGVYAPLASPETTQPAVPSNTWARKPAGLAGYYGTHTESATQSLEKMQQRIANLNAEGAADE